MDRPDAMQEVYYQSDKLMLGVIVFLFFFSLALASWHDTWGIAFFIGLPAALLPILVIITAPGTLLARLLVGLAFMVFAALHIQQAHGMIELHFGIFVLIAFLLYYRDWKVILIAAAAIAVHHLTFNYLQEAGYPIYVFDHHQGFSMVLTHAAYVVFESGLMIYMATQAAAEARRNIELQEISKSFAINNGVIDLSYGNDGHDSDFANDFNGFMLAVNQAIGKCQELADRLTASIQQWHGLNGDIRKFTELERRNTLDIAEAVTRISTTVQGVADDSLKAAAAAKETDSLVETGARVLNQTISAITKLAASVEQTSQVILNLESSTVEIGVVLKVIKDIADQTNLLALNAAIEAARAGEQGRGFSVVADEVRSLANRTQKSTADIQKMIDGLQSHAKAAAQVMRDGGEQARLDVQQASRTGEAFSSIAKSVSAINILNSQIAGASEQQTSVVNQILANINKIANIASETSVDSNALDRLCGDLLEMTGQLKTLVGKFKC